MPSDVMGYEGGLPGAIGRLSGMPRASAPRVGGLPQVRPLADPTFDARAIRDAYAGGQEARRGIDRGAAWLSNAFLPPPSAMDGAFAGGGLVDGVPIAIEIAEGGVGAGTAGGVGAGTAGGIGFARGGLADASGISGGAMPGGARVARKVGRMGLVSGSSPGRADLVGTKLQRGSYVIPADVVSGLGEGNTMAGAKLLGTTLPALAQAAGVGAGTASGDRSRMPGMPGMPGMAGGGLADANLHDGSEVGVRLSGGEFLVAPEQVLAIGGGDAQAGAAVLDDLIAAVRESVGEHAENAPGPV